MTSNSQFAHPFALHAVVLTVAVICAAVRGDLIRILTKLMKRKKKLDAILVETTGLADPAPVAQTFFVDDEIKEGMRLDSILTIVDSKHIVQHLNEKKEAGIINESGVCLSLCPLTTYG
jgi:G3E family GTPase